MNKSWSGYGEGWEIAKCSEC